MAIERSQEAVQANGEVTQYLLYFTSRPCPCPFPSVTGNYHILPGAFVNSAPGGIDLYYFPAGNSSTGRTEITLTFRCIPLGPHTQVSLAFDGDGKFFAMPVFTR